MISPKKKPSKTVKPKASPKKPVKPPDNGGSKKAEGYKEFRDSQAEISRDRSATGREIGPLPAVVDPKRKATAFKSLRKFLETYLSAWFPLAWSEDHLDAIQLLELTIREGGLYAFAMPRGSGKTCLSEGASLWAAAYGLRKFIVLIGATSGLAEASLDSLKNELETNDLLAEDFPEICQPIRTLEGISNRCTGQTHEGVRTRISWKKNTIVLPTIPGSSASGVRVRSAGLTSSIRGMKAKGPDGEIVRPDLAVVDDPQTDRSALSTSQNITREKLVNGAVLGLAGPGKKISAVMPCTVIATGDMVDRQLDRKIHPEWNGKRSKMLRTFPSNHSLWDEYAKVRKDGLRADDRGKAATKFYRANRRAMDLGAEVSWPARFNADELSAIQSAMNLFIDNPRAFAAEYQNDPEPLRLEGSLVELTAEDVAQRTTRLPRFVVPHEGSRLTAFIDLQQRVLYYMVCAWDERFGGSIIDYGAFPQPNRAYFSANDARPSLADRYPGDPEEAAIYKGLKELSVQILGRSYPRQHGEGTLRVERCLVDSGKWSDTVYSFCERSTHATLLTPSKGFGISSASMTMAEWKRKPGERIGWNWLYGFPESGRGRLLKFDTNAWKSFVAGRLRSAEGARGGLYLFGERPSDHQMLADHLCSENRTLTQGRGREVEIWKRRPNAENHWWDCLVGCAVAAGFQGLTFDAGKAAGDPGPATTAKKRVSYAEARSRSRKKG